MKKLMMMALLALFATTTLSAQNKGVDFAQGTFKELLEKAGQANKYLFVDVYATWCGPCKYMSGRVFTQEKVGDYFNKTFVNAKFDAERGEGMTIARKYRVEAYPTFLILNAEGKEVGRIVGGDDADAFIKKVQEVVANIR